MAHLPVCVNKDAHRREWSRLATELPAKVISLRDRYNAVLLNLSLTGAQVHVRRVAAACEIPDLSGEVLLQWLNYEAFGRFIWQYQTSDGTWGGINFDNRLTPAMLIATRDQHDLTCNDGGIAGIEQREVAQWVSGTNHTLRW